MYIIICFIIRVKKYYVGYYEDWVVVEFMGGVRLLGKVIFEGVYLYSYQDYSGQFKYLYYQDQNREKG